MGDDLRPTWNLGATERAAARWRIGHRAGRQLRPRVEQLRAGDLGIHPDLRVRLLQPSHEAARHVIEQVGRSAALLDPPSPAGTGPRPEVAQGALPAQRTGLFQLRGAASGPAGPVAPFAAVGRGPAAPPRPAPRQAPPPPPQPPLAGEGQGLFDPFDGLVEIVDSSDRDR